LLKTKIKSNFHAQPDMKNKLSFSILVIVSLLSFFLLYKESIGQNRDSLWKVYNDEEQSDTNRLKAIYSIAWSYRGNNPDTAIVLALQELEFARKLKQKMFEGKALNTLGVAYMNKGNYPKAMEYFLKVLRIREELGDKKGIGSSYNNLGNVYRLQSNYTKALEYFLKYLKICEETGDRYGTGVAYLNIGLVYVELGKPEKGLEYYDKYLKICEEMDDKQGIGYCYNNIGNAYHKLGNYSKALEYHEKSLKVKEEINDKKGMGYCFNNIGEIYSKQFNYPKALEYFLKALKIRREVGFNKGIVESYNGIGSLYNQLYDYKSAIQYSDSALNLAKKIGDIEGERIAYENLAIVHANTGDYKQAYTNYVQFKQRTDSIFNNENSKQLSELKTNFEVEKKEVELKAKAEEQHARQRIIIYSVAALLLLVILFLSFLYNRFRIIRRQKHIIEIQKELVDEKQKEILDSITYAKRLQEAILPPLKHVTEYFPESFILYKPKDIVAGDFYWMETRNENLETNEIENEKSNPQSNQLSNQLVFLAAADCTGHGVPGAMVSVVCSNSLNRTVKEFGITEPGKILDKVTSLVIETFEKSESEVKDGMDISLIHLNLATKELQWAGANNPLWIIEKNKHEITEIKADKQPIGQFANIKNFTTHKLNLTTGDLIYLFTDGFADQFGGEKGKKFKYNKLKDLLISIKDKNQTEQKEILNDSFEAWRGRLEQVDDVCIIGIRI